MKSLTFHSLFLLFFIMVIGTADLLAQDLPCNQRNPTGKVKSLLLLPEAHLLSLQQFGLGIADPDCTQFRIRNNMPKILEESPRESVIASVRCGICNIAKQKEHLTSDSFLRFRGYADHTKSWDNVISANHQFSMIALLC